MARSKQTARKSTGCAGPSRTSFMDDDLRPVPCSPPPQGSRTVWEKDTFVDASKSREDVIQRIGEKAMSLVDACTAARQAQQVLQQQAASLDVLVQEADDPQQPQAQLLVALADVQEALAQQEATMKAAKAALGRLETKYCEIRCSSGDLQLPAAATTALAKHWNRHHSPLLSLPDSALHLFARACGPTSRLVCRRMADVYGCPATTIEWNVLEMDAGNTPALMDNLSSLAHTWRWPMQLQELRLCKAVPVTFRARQALAADLPTLKRLSMSANAKQYARSRAPQWPSLTALTCLVPYDTPLLLPYASPNLHSLELLLSGKTDPDNQADLNLHAALQPLPALTHLAVLPPEWVALSPANAKDLAATLTALSSTLASLRLRAPDTLLGHLGLLPQLQLRSLAIDTWNEPLDSLENFPWLPKLAALPSLQHLHMCGLDLGADLLPELQEALGCGSRALQSLTLPGLYFSEGADKATIGHALQAMWRNLPTLTKLVVHVGADYYYKDEPDSAAGERDLHWRALGAWAACSTWTWH